MNYTELKASVNDWLARSDLTTANADFFIDLAEAKINRSLRIRPMEKVYNELLQADGTTPCELSLLEFKHLFLVDVVDDGFLDIDDDITIDESAILVQNFGATDKVIRLEWRGVDEMAGQWDRDRSGKAEPKYVTRYGDRLYFWPYSDEFKYTAVGIAYEKFTALSDEAPTNHLTDEAPDLLLSGVLNEASIYIKSPDQSSYWQARFDRALNELQGQDARQEFTGTPLTICFSNPMP